MEASAYGLGLLPEEFWNLTFHEFFLIQRGRNEVKEMKERFEWERVRWLGCVFLQPHAKKSKRISPKDLIEFEWEKKEYKTKDTLEERRKRAEYAIKLYKQLNTKEDGGKKTLG